MKFNSLESLRGVCAIIVAVFHSGFVFGEKHPVIAQGDIFVDFFFILSGFVMAYAYGEKIQNGLSFQEFITLRIGRLYPLHFFTLLLWLSYIVIKACAFYAFDSDTHSDLFVKNNVYTFVSNLFLLNSMGYHDYLSWNYPAWSISVEFFTYMTFFVCIVFSKFIRSSAKFILISVFLYSALYLLTNSTILSTYEYGFIRCLGGFFLGVWLYEMSKKTSMNVSFLGASVLEVISVTVMLGCVFWSPLDKAIQLLVIISFAVMILIFSVQEKGIISRGLNQRFMLYLGTLSYSIYMTHAIIFSIAGDIYQYVLKLPVKMVAHGAGDPVKYFDVWYADIINVVCLAVIIFVSSKTYKYVERPWRNIVRRKVNALKKDERVIVPGRLSV